MKRIIKLSVFFAVIALLSTSCGKEKDNTYNEIPNEYLSIEVEIIN